MVLEQVYGAWTASVAGLVAQRLAREVQARDVALGAEWTLIAAGAYTFDSEVALAASAAYRIEGDAEARGCVLGTH